MPKGNPGGYKRFGDPKSGVKKSRGTPRKAGMKIQPVGKPKKVR